MRMCYYVRGSGRVCTAKGKGMHSIFCIGTVSRGLLSADRLWWVAMCVYVCIT